MPHLPRGPCQSACLLLHQNHYSLLCLGRFLSGIAAAFLSTCFECWMVSEHNRLQFPPQLLGSTFSAYVFLMVSQPPVDAVPP